LSQTFLRLFPGQRPIADDAWFGESTPRGALAYGHPTVYSVQNVWHVFMVNDLAAHADAPSWGKEFNAAVVAGLRSHCHQVMLKKKVELMSSFLQFTTEMLSRHLRDWIGHHAIFDSHSSRILPIHNERSRVDNEFTLDQIGVAVAANVSVIPLQVSLCVCVCVCMYVCVCVCVRNCCSVNSMCWSRLVSCGLM